MEKAQLGNVKYKCRHQPEIKLSVYLNIALISYWLKLYDQFGHLCCCTLNGSTCISMSEFVDSRQRYQALFCQNTAISAWVVKCINIQIYFIYLNSSWECKYLIITVFSCENILLTWRWKKSDNCIFSIFNYTNFVLICFIKRLIDSLLFRGEV